MTSRTRPCGRELKILALATAALLIAACSGSGKGTGVDNTASTAGSSTVAAPSTLQTTTTTPAFTLTGTVGVVCSGDTIKLYSASGRSFSLAKTISLSPGPNGWTTSPGNACTKRAAWSAKFEKLILIGRPPGVEAAHVGVLDLSSMELVDLTAPRQGSGFSAPILSETDAGFLGPGGDRISYGSDEVAILSTSVSVTSATIVPLSNPSKTRTIPAEGSSGVSGGSFQSVPGHPEMFARPFGPNQNDQQNVPNPSGSLVVNGEKILPARGLKVDYIGTSGGVKMESCDHFVPVFLGWLDSSSFVVFAKGAHIAKVNATATSYTCSPSFIPPSDKTIHGVSLALDRSGVFFVADSVSGSTNYFVPLSGGEPTSQSPPALPDGIVIFTPVE